MPTSNEILDQLARAADEFVALAIVWHLVVLIVALAIVFRWRIVLRSTAALPILIATSVVVVSIGYGNWFNAASFFVLAVALTMSTENTAAGVQPWQPVLGAALVVFGFVYPHFVDGAWYRSLYAAPMGVLPCPTLALIAGYVLITGGRRSRAIVVATWTAFYAVFGTFELGVLLDLGLVAGTIGLVALAIQNDGRAAAASGLDAARP